MGLMEDRSAAADTDEEVVKMKTDHCSRSFTVKVRRKRYYSLKGHFASMGSVLFLGHRCDLFVKFQRPVSNFMHMNCT